MIISDEAHRCIGGNARAVFEHFVGYKLGLTATPKDYLENFEQPTIADGERARRLDLDTYRAFGCDDGLPTYQFGLDDGAKLGFLIQPTVVDARTGVTTRLLAEQGFFVTYRDEQGEEQQETFEQRQFEKRFFSPHTNALFCKTLLERGLRDPVTGEFGKTIVFAVRRHHAAALTQIHNQMATQMFPGRYQSDFAVQVTSNVADAAQYAKNFTHDANKLMGSGNFNPQYRTSKARVCVTVGMMTTGYDCADILNLALMRPIFSPPDFVQIKGRGTRKRDFREQAFDPELRAAIQQPQKTAYKLFDFFANCEYFQNEFDYDEVLELPKGGSESPPGDPPLPQPPGTDGYTHREDDAIVSVAETVYPGGMRVDQMFFTSFAEAARNDPTLAAAIEAGRWDEVIDHVNHNLLNRPSQFFTLEKLRRAAGVDRRADLREILEYVFGLIPRLKSKNELLEEDFAKFVADQPPSDPQAVPAIKTFFKAYTTSKHLQAIIDAQDFAQLHTNPGFTFGDFKAMPDQYRRIVSEYVKDYLPLNQFA